MKDTSLKLSGPAMDRFFKRLLAEERGLPDDAASRLLARCKLTFTSVRVRKAAHARLGRRIAGAHGADVSERSARQAQSAPAPSAPVAPQSSEAAPPSAAEPPQVAFDPYVFGLVPVFQREGRDGLLAKLGTIAGASELRHMAKAQQIILPAELRSGEAAPEAIRIAIADAVARRIADRRAAAG